MCYCKKVAILKIIIQKKNSWSRNTICNLSSFSHRKIYQLLADAMEKSAYMANNLILSYLHLERHITSSPEISSFEMECFYLRFLIPLLSPPSLCSLNGDKYLCYEHK